MQISTAFLLGDLVQRHYTNVNICGDDARHLNANTVAKAKHWVYFTHKN